MNPLDILAWADKKLLVVEAVGIVANRRTVGFLAYMEGMQSVGSNIHREANFHMGPHDLFAEGGSNDAGFGEK